MTGPLGPVSDGRGRAGTLLVVLGVLAAVAAAVGLAAYALWPSDGDGGASASGSGSGSGSASGVAADDEETTTTGEGQVTPETTATTGPPTTRLALASLFDGGLPVALADLLAAAGGPEQVLSISVYDAYAFVAYRDPADPAAVDRREWRDGEVGEPEPNPATDRVDADVEPRLFSPTELDPTIVALLIADAPLQYDVPVTVSHVIIDRFLPFDERVLIRVYTVPADGRSGGGYVSYDTAGTLVRVCC